ncbi:site-specific integrase [Paracoccus lichenicola]|nr:site-specific integrase [Paracoccus lichenicola]
MKYVDIRQHVLDHFRGMLDRFKDGVDDSGPLGPVRYAALETTQGLADSDLDTWAGLIHPEGPDGLVQAFCAQRGIPAADLSAQHRAWLLDALRKGHHAFAKAALGHVDALERFDLDMPPGNAAGAGTADDDAASGQTQISYQEVVDQYFAEVARSGGVAVKTDADKRAALNLLAEITGDKTVAAITKADAQQAKQVLMQYPANRQKNRITRGKPLSEVLDLPGVPKIAAKTLNSYLSNMETFMGWAVRNGHADANHFAGMQVKVQRAKADQRDPFTDAQLARLYEHLIDNPMNLVKTDAAKWGSLVGMFTGMRLNEIAQLETADIKQVDGVWVIDVSDVGEGNRKRLKTAAADRRVPLHDRLIATGFLDFVEAQRDARQERLFPALSFCPKNGYGRAIGRWFNNTLLPKLGMKSKTLVFHSFRHTMNTRLYQADVPEAQIKAIIGHEQQGVSTGTYLKDGFRPAQLKAAIDRFEF